MFWSSVRSLRLVGEADIQALQKNMSNIVTAENTYLVKRLSDGVIFEVTPQQADDFKRVAGLQVLGIKDGSASKPAEGEYKCEQCDKTFTSRIALVGHLKSHVS